MTVKKMGPLWAYSMFSFEGKNGLISNVISGKNQVIKELANKFRIIHSFQHNIKNHKNDSELIKISKKRILTNSLFNSDLFNKVKIYETNSVVIGHLFIKKKTHSCSSD
jgi:hypothetical protein